MWFWRYCNLPARLCVEYFTIFHAPIFGGTDDPTLLSSSFALFGVRRFIAALVFFDLAPIIRYPM
jgi:hypothetical protein